MTTITHMRDVARKIDRSRLLTGGVGPGSLVQAQSLGVQQKVLAISLSNASATSNAVNVGTGNVSRFMFPLTANTIPGPIVRMSAYIGNSQGLAAGQGLRVMYAANVRAAANGEPVPASEVELANTGITAMRAVGASSAASPINSGFPTNAHSNLALQLFSGDLLGRTDTANVLVAYARVVVEYLGTAPNPVLHLSAPTG